RVNDRRLLIGMLTGFGFPAEAHEAVLVTLDKLDKLGPEGVVAELRQRVGRAAAVDAVEAFLRRRAPAESRLNEAAIRGALPEGADASVIAELVALGAAVAAARGADSGSAP